MVCKEPEVLAHTTPLMAAGCQQDYWYTQDIQHWLHTAGTDIPKSSAIFQSSLH